MFGRVRFDNKSETANLARIVRTCDAEIGAFGWGTGQRIAAPTAQPPAFPMMGI